MREALQLDVTGLNPTSQWDSRDSNHALESKGVVSANSPIGRRDGRDGHRHRLPLVNGSSLID